jgi:quercetin dioxygenase-like cupin family protein
VRSVDPGATVTESRLRSRLVAEGLSPSLWGNGPGDRYAPHRHEYDKVLVAASGSIKFELTDSGQDVELVAGDRLDLPAGIMHGALVGPNGVSCLEAHLAHGALGAQVRLLTGWSERTKTAGPSAA